LEHIDDFGKAYLQKFKMAVAAILLGFRQTVAISLLCHQSSPNLVGILQLWFKTHRWRRKINVTIIQDGGGRHLGFWKNCCQFSTIWPIITKICEDIGTSIWNIFRQECIVSKIQDGGRRYLGFRKTVAMSLLIDGSSSNLVRILLLWFRRHRWRRTIYITIIQDGGSLDFGTRLPFLYYLTDLHQTLVETLGLWFRSHLLHWKCIIAKIQNDGRHRRQFRKTFVISSLFD